MNIQSLIVCSVICLHLLAGVKVTMGWLQSQENTGPVVIIDNKQDEKVGSPLTLRLEGMPKETKIKIFSELIDRYGRLWIGQSEFMSDADGMVDPATQVPLSGEWKNRDGIGPFWALKRMTKSDAHPRPENGNAERIAITALVDDRPVATSSSLRFFRDDSVKEVPIDDDRLVGRMFMPRSGKSEYPAIIVVPGSGGGIPTGMAEQLASHGYVALALAYFGEPNLPDNLELVPLEYFDRAIDWLKQKPFVNESRIGLLGGSKGGELVLLLGTRREDVRAIVSIVPSTHVFQSISDQWNRTSSWSVGGKGLPFVAYKSSAKFRESDVLRDLYEESLNDASADSRIPMEKIVGNVLLITGSEDQTWPANAMCEEFIKRFPNLDNFEHQNYSNVGHEAFASGYRPTSWSKRVGGTRQGQALAQAKSWVSAIDFLSTNLKTKETTEQLETGQLKDPIKFDSELATQLDQIIKKEHVRPFWKTNQQKYSEILNQARESLDNPKLNKTQKAVQLLRIIAALKDGHSSMTLPSRKKLFGFVPLLTEFFGDEIRVVAIPKENEDLLGGKIIKINGADIDKIKHALLSVVPHANDQRFKKACPWYLQHPGVLFGLGFGDNPSAIVVEVEKMDGTTAVGELRTPETNVTSPAKLVTINKLIAENRPLYLRSRGRIYWHQYIPEKKLFYVRLHRISSDPNNPIWTWAAQMWSEADQLEIDKFVIDLRGNGGGGFQYCMPIVQGVIDRPKINQTGKLFTITDHKTFSAAIGMVEQLENRTQTMIIGEAPCDHPASPGDSDVFELGEAGIEVSLSQVFHTTIFPDDKRTQVGLDHEVVTDWGKLMHGNDPAMGFIHNYDAAARQKTDRMPEDLAGNFEFDGEKNVCIELIDQQPTLRIGPFFRTPLYRASSGEFETEVKGFTLRINNGDSVELRFPDGSNKTCQRLTSAVNAPLDLLFAGRIDEAKLAFKKLLEQEESNGLINDSKFSHHATLIYWHCRSRFGRAKAVERIQSTLNLAVEVIGDAPICESMKQYYR